MRGTLRRSQKDEAVLRNTQNSDDSADNHDTQAQSAWRNCRWGSPERLRYVVFVTRGDDMFVARDWRSAGPPQHERDRGGQQANDRQMIAQTEREGGDGGEKVHAAASGAPPQEQGDRERHHHGREAVDLGDQRVSPEARAGGEAETGAGGSPARGSQLSRDRVGEHTRHGRHHGGEEIRPVGDRPNRQLDEEVREEHVQRIAGRVSGAEDVAEELKFRRVLGPAEIRLQRRQIEGQGRETDGQRPEGIARAGRSHHARKTLTSGGRSPEDRR